MQSEPKSIQIALSGGVITSREAKTLPFGSFSSLQNIRWRHPGFEKRAGQRSLHTTADGTNNVLSIYQYKKSEVTEKHLYAQMSDGDLLEASAAPPIVTTGVFGSEVYSGASGQVPAAYSVINDLLVYSNGVDQHQIYGGINSYIDQFIVYKGSVSFPAFPQIGEDYSNQVSDGYSDTIAVLDSLGTYSNKQCLFIRTPVKVKSFTFTITKPNTRIGNVSIYYYNGAWATVGSVTDGTKLGSTTFAKSGKLSFTAPANVQSKYQFGNNAWWYQVGFSAGLSGEVEVSEITFESDFQDIENLWDGVPVNAVEVYVDAVTIDVEDGDEKIVNGTFDSSAEKITNPRFNSGISGWDDLDTEDGVFSYDPDTYSPSTYAKLSIKASGAGMSAMGQTITGLIVGRLYILSFYIYKNYAYDNLFAVTGGSAAYGGTEFFSKIYKLEDTGTKIVSFTAVATSLYLRFKLTPHATASYMYLDTISLKGDAWTDLSTGTGVVALQVSDVDLNAKDSGAATIGQKITVVNAKTTTLEFTVSDFCTNLIVTGGSDAYGNTQHFTKTFTTTGAKTIEFTTVGTTLYLQFKNTFDETITLDGISLYHSTTTTTESVQVFASGAVDISSLPAGKRIKIGTSYKLEGIYIDPGNTPNIGTPPTPTIKHWDGSTNTSVGAVTDESDGMATAGYLLFPRKTGVQPSNLEGSFHYINWYELTWSEDIAADTVIEITLIPFFEISDFGKSQCNCIWKDRVALSFNRWGSDIYVSRTKRPMVYNGADFGILSAGDGRKNKVVAMRNYYNWLVAFQEDMGFDGGCVTLFKGYSPTTYGKQIISTKLGTFNNNCVVVVDGAAIATKTDETVKTVIYFLSRLGICMFDGQTIAIVSDDIQNYFDSTKTECISRKYAHRMWLNHDSAENILRVGLVSGISATKANVFPVYDLIDKVWAFDTPEPGLTCIAEIETGDEADYPSVQIAGTTGYVYQLNYGKNDNETAIPVVISVEIDAVSEVLQLSALTSRIKDS